MIYLKLHEIKTMAPLALSKLKRRPVEQPTVKPAKKSNRFDGLSEEEVQKNTLPDYLEPDLDIVFVGINPGLMSAYRGRYYAGPGNHFYPLLSESKIVPVPVTYEDDENLLQYKIGLTNMIGRATRSSADLKKTEIKMGAKIVKDKLRHFKPKIAVFNGKCIYEEFADCFDKKNFMFGLQPVCCGETSLWVVPSSSARCANFPRMENKLHFYTSLKKYLSFLKGEIEEVNLKEFVFEGKCKQAVPSTSKMWRRQNLSAFANGGKVVNKATVCMDTSDENICAVPESLEFIIKETRVKDSSNGMEEGKIELSQSDSGIGRSDSEMSDFFSQESQSKEASVDNKCITAKLKPVNQSKKRKSPKASIVRSPQERTEVIDFVTLIKQKLMAKEKVIDTNEISNNNNSESNEIQENNSKKTGMKKKKLCR